MTTNHVHLGIDHLRSLSEELYEVIRDTIDHGEYEDIDELKIQLRQNYENLNVTITASTGDAWDISDIVVAANIFSNICRIIIHEFLKDKLSKADFNIIRTVMTQHTELIKKIDDKNKDQLKSSDFDRANSFNFKFEESIRSVNTQFKTLSESIEHKSDEVDTINSEMESLREKISAIEIDAAQTLAMVKKSYEEGLSYLSSKQGDVDQLVGSIGGKSIVGSYEASSASEKGTADNLRTGAIFFMVLVLAVITYTFYEITIGDFSFEKTLLKIICSILFSVPAAYLARESAKHRQQQYAHLQTALDLKAMGPYIATLPKDKQDELRAEMAQKIFTPKTFEHVTKESYPINSQELILALFEKINDKKSANDKSKDSAA